MDFIVLTEAVVLLVLTVMFVRFTPHPALVVAAEARLDQTKGAMGFATSTLLAVLRWGAVLAIVTVVIVLLNEVHGAFTVLRLVLLNRYALVVAGLLVGLVLLGLVVAPSLLGNLFVLQGPWQLFNITWISLLTATMVVATCRVAEVNAVTRYGISQLGGDPTLLLWVRAANILILGLPVPYACLRQSLVVAPTPLSVRLWAEIGLVGGAVFALALVALAIALQSLLLAPEVVLDDLLPLQAHLAALNESLGLRQVRPFSGLGHAIAYLFHFLGAPGLVLEGTDGSYTLAPGHAQPLAAMIVGLAFYMGYYVVVQFGRLTPNRNGVFPSMFFVLLLMILAGFILQGTAFVLDVHRFPVSVAVFLFVFVLYQFNHTDHFFELTPARKKRRGAPDPEQPQAPLTLDQAAGAWQLPSISKDANGIPGKKTLVVVTASGGGIQASAWVSRVLVGLHQVYGNPFSRSIGLVSAVSGGSVGAMYCLDRWQEQGPVFPPEAIGFKEGKPGKDSICERAMASSLEATAWGLAFPDLLRILFPPIVPRTDDRGSRIENAWRSRLESPDARLRDWVKRIKNGSLPIPVFNATVAETGQRLVSSPVVVRAPGATPPSASDAQELLHLYKEVDPRVSTAVRLSATFPFISPICRPLPGSGSKWNEDIAYHYADGGYVDNEGMVTVIDWLNHLLDPHYFLGRSDVFDQVLFIRLMPFPDLPHADPAKPGKGWFYSTYGPIDALQHVRVASQAERNHIAVNLFTEKAKANGVRVGEARFTFDLQSRVSPPLSWMLTAAQKDDVERAWSRILERRKEQNSPLYTVDQFF